MSDEDIAILQRGVVGKGDGGDTYVLSNNLVQNNAKITLSDSGFNTLHLIDGLEIASSKVAANALLLTLSNGAEITVLDASNYEFVVGGDPITGETGTSYDLQGLASNVLGVEVPSSGIASGGNITLGQAPSSSADIVIESTMDTLVVQRGITGKGSGHDTFVLSNTWIEAGAEITITDTGNNTIQFIDGLEVASSMVAPNALMLTLSNGATVTVLDADEYTFEVGGNTIQNEKGYERTFSEFINQSLSIDTSINTPVFHGPQTLISKSNINFLQSLNLSLSQESTNLNLSYYADGGDRWAVRYLYPKNIDGSLGDELIVAGFETQPNSAEQYSNTNMFIIDFTSGIMTNITDDIVLTEPLSSEGIGDIAWGDFNGDSQTDFFTSAYTDMDFPVNSYSYIYSQNGFERKIVDFATWQHGVASADINSDGYNDVYAASYSGSSIYFGSQEGLIKYELTGDYGGGSSVALGDFLNNGEVQAIVVDAGIAGLNSSDTVMFEITTNLNEHLANLRVVTTLPPPILETDEFQEILKFDGEKSHDVRIESLDFSNDGLLDVIVFSRSGFDSSKGYWPKFSQVQFLQNQGDGDFSDVTSNILKNYDSNSNVGYEPVFADFNKDGFLDIFISDSDWDSPHRSTVFLLGSNEHSFVEFGRDYLSEFIPPIGGMATVVEDSIGNFWLVTAEQSDGDFGRQESLSSFLMDFY